MSDTKTEEIIFKLQSLFETISHQKAQPIWWMTISSTRDRFLSRLRYQLDLLDQRNVDGLYNLKPSDESLTKYIKLILKPFFVLNTLIKLRRDVHTTYQKRIKQIQSRPLLVIKSFNYAHNFILDSFKDPFWSDLIPYLENKKGTKFIVLSEPMGSIELATKYSIKNENFFVPLYFLKLSDPFKALLMILSGYFVPRTKGIHYNGKNVDALIHINYLQELSSQATYMAILNYLIYQNVSKIFSIDKFLLPYEGLCWENAAILGIKKNHPNLKIIGKQHAVISEAAITNFPLNSPYYPVPHIINTTGKITYKMIKHFNRHPMVSIVSGCAFRFTFNSSEVAKSSPIRPVILLGLEGVLNCKTLIEYAVRNMKDLPDWKLIIRPHPILPFEKLKPTLNINPESFSNIEISKGKSLDEDLSRSGILLYWGSTLCLDALGKGIPVIHYEYQNSLNFDPLVNFTDLKWVVGPNANLIDTVRKIINLEDLAERRAKAQSFILDYFSPPSESQFEFLIGN